MPSIGALDADVISNERSRSDMERCRPLSTDCLAHLWLQDSVNWRHRMVHLAVPSGLFAVWVNFERGGPGEYRSDGFRGLDTTDVSADAIALSKSEGEVDILLLSSSIEGM